MPGVLSKISPYAANPQILTSLAALAAGLGIYVTQRSHGT